MTHSLIDRLRKLNVSQRLTLLLMLTASVGVVVWQYNAGRWLDDYAYMTVPLYGEEIAAAGLPHTEIEVFTDCVGPAIDDVGSLADAMWRHYMLINGRLANMLGFVGMQLPLWLLALLQGVAYCAMITGALRLSAPRGDVLQHPLRALLMVAALWVVLPWCDGLSSGVFMINYVWSAALALWFVIAMMERRLSVVWLSVLGFVAATMHEGFTVAVGCVLPLLCLGVEKPLRRRNLIAAAVFVAGGILMLAAPGLQNRIDSQAEAGWAFMVRNILIGLLPVWVALVCFALTLLRKNGREKIVVLRRSVVAGVMVAGVAICLAVGQADRAAWLPLLLSQSLIFDIVGSWLSRFKGSQKLILSAFMLGYVLLSLWMIELIVWQHRASEERDEVMRQAEAAHRPVAYQDCFTYNDVPWWLFEIPCHAGSSRDGAVEMMGAHIFKKVRSNIAVLPTSWRDLPVDSLPLIEGNAGLRGEGMQFCTRRRLNHPWANAVYDPSLTVDWSANAAPIHLLKLRLLRARTAPVTFQEVGVPVASGDTLWYYRLREGARSLRMLPVVRFDTVPD